MLRASIGCAPARAIGVWLPPPVRRVAGEPSGFTCLRIAGSENGAGNELRYIPVFSRPTVRTGAVYHRLMVFSSQLFLFYFLPASLVLYYFSPRWLRHLMLAAVSYVFYG